METRAHHFGPTARPGPVPLPVSPPDAWRAAVAEAEAAFRAWCEASREERAERYAAYLAAADREAAAEDHLRAHRAVALA